MATTIAAPPQLAGLAGSAALEPMEGLPLRVPAELKARYADLAERYQCGRSVLLRTALRQWLEQIENTEAPCAKHP